MPVTKHEHTTNGRDGAATWAMNNLPATEGLKALTQILGIIGEPLGALGEAKKSSNAADLLGMELSGDIIAKALAAIARNVADPKTIDLVKLLLSGLRKDGKPVNFDLEFSGNYRLLLLELLPWSLKVNFADFLDGESGLPSLLGRVRDLVPAPTPVTSTSASSAS